MLFGVLLAVLIATTVMGGAPAYLDTLDRVGVEGVLDDLPPVGKNVVITNPLIPSRLGSSNAVTTDIEAASGKVLGDVASSARRAHRSPYHRNLDPETVANWSLARFVLMDGFEENVDFITGVPPNDPINDRPGATAGIAAEAAVPEDMARKLGISAGETLKLQLLAGSGSAVDVIVSGTFVPHDESGEFWMGFAQPLLRPELLPGFGGGAAALFLTAEGFGAVALEAAPTPMDSAWIIDLDHERLSARNPAEIAEMVERFEVRIEQDVPRSIVITGLEKAFSALERRSIFARIPMFLMATILLTIVVYYLLMAASVLADRRKDEIGSLRSRGVSLAQLGRLYGLEGALLVGIPVLLGPPASLGLISQAGRVPPFDDVTGGDALPVSFFWAQYVLAMVTGLVALAVLVSPTVLSGAGNVVTQLRDRARPGGTPFFQRYFLDAALVAVTAFLLWELGASGSEVIRVDEDGALSTDPVLFFAPAFALLGVSLIFLRIFPPVLRGISALAARMGPAWVSLAVWRLGRAPYSYAPLVLLLMLASGLAVIAATLASTLDESARERILYDTGADIRVESARGAIDHVETIRTFPAVYETSAAMRMQGSIGTRTGGPAFELLGVQTDRFAEISWFRPDFSTAAFEDLMAELSSGEPPERMMLPPGTTDLGIWTQTDDDIDHLFLWATIRGGTGIVETVTLGPVVKGGWNLQAASLEGIIPPVELLSIKLFEPAGDDRATAGAILLDDLVAIDSLSGSTTVVTGFDSPDGWTAFPTSEGLDAAFSISAEATGTGQSDGSGVGRFDFGRGSDGGVRGIYRSASGGPLPVVVSSTLVENGGISPGIPFIARLSGGLTPLVPVAVVDFFPTLDPDTDSGFLLLDLEGLASYLDLKGAVSSSLIDELFVGVKPGQEESARADIETLLSAAARIDVRSDKQSESLVNPLSVAGWRGVGVLAGLTTMVVVVLGYLTYLRSYAGRMNSEEAFVRSLGMTRLNYLAGAAIEHFALGLAGIVLGLVSGLAISGLAVEVSTRTASGGEPLPPFNLATQWESILVGSTFLGVIAIAALGFLTVRYSRRALHDATRLEK